MGGTEPHCPFCLKLYSGLKDHIRDKHPDRYKEWISLEQPPYWKYNNGEFIYEGSWWPKQKEEI